MIDELNTFEAEFGKMGISKEQKRKRVELAETLLDVFLYAFSWAAMQHENGVGDAVIEQELWEMLEQDILSSIPDEVKYTESVPESHIEISSEDGIDSYVKDQIFVLAASIAATTIAHIAQEYYTSYERAWKAAVDESHSIYNYFDEREAILSGKTSKTWNTVLDGRERTTHNAADGQTVPIGGVFKVGSSLLRFPLDNSLGADVSEIAGCRCWVTYGNKYTAVQKKSIEKPVNRDIIRGQRQMPMNLQFFSEKALKNQSDADLLRGIRSLEAQIEEHKYKIAHPSEFWMAWDTFDSARKERELWHWEKEIKNFEKSIENRRIELTERGKL